MGERTNPEQREAILWAVGLPLAVVAATMTLLALLSHITGQSYSSGDLTFLLLVVSIYGLPAALLARRFKPRLTGSITYHALAGTVAGFAGLAIVAVVLIWAEGGKDAYTALAEATWRTWIRVGGLTAAIAWPGALAGLAGGTVFGVFANWARHPPAGPTKLD